MSQSVSRRPAPMRWLAAILVTLAMLLGTTGVAVFAQSGSSGGPVFVPASAVGYGELRLDLPGDQHDSLAAFMAHFPGFADQASFDAKLDELLDQVVSSASGGSATWTGDIEPWSNGQLAVAILALPEQAGNAGGFGADDDPQMVIALGVADRTALESELERILSLADDDDVTTEQHQGSTITSVDDDVSYAVTDQYLLVAPEADQVKASLDVLAGAAPSLAADAAFQVAAARVPPNHLAASYFSTASLVPFLEQQLAQQPDAQLILDQLDRIPAWVSGYTQVASDSLTFAGDIQYPSGMPVPATRESDLAEHFPAGRFGYIEVRDVGATAHATIEQLLTAIETQDPDATAGIEQLERILGVPLEELLDSIEDVAVGVGRDDDGRFGVGMAATILDETTTQQRVTSFIALARMGLANAPVEVTQTDVDGIEVTTFRMQDDASTAQLPIDVAVSIAVGDGHLYIGSGDFAATAITQDAAASLASDTRYADAVAIAGSPNAGLVWIDVAAVQATAEALMPADEDYLTDVKPWLDAIDQVVLSSTTDQEGIVSGRLVILVR